MLGQGVKRWHFADPVVPCRQHSHRHRPGRRQRHTDAPAQVSPLQPSRPSPHHMRTPPPKLGKCRPPVARGAATGRPLRPYQAGPSKPPCGGWEPLVFSVPLRLCWSLGQVVLNLNLKRGKVPVRCAGPKRGGHHSSGGGYGGPDWTRPGGTGGTGVHRGTPGGTAGNPMDGGANVEGAAASRGPGGEGKGGWGGRCGAGQSRERKGEAPEGGSGGRVGHAGGRQGQKGHAAEVGTEAEGQGDGRSECLDRNWRGTTRAGRPHQKM